MAAPATRAKGRDWAVVSTAIDPYTLPSAISTCSAGFAMCEMNFTDVKCNNEY